MEVVLGIFSWQDIVKYQDQNIELNFVADTKKYRKPTKLKEYKERADRTGRIMAFPIHLPYIKQHYKNVTINEDALEILKKYHNEFIG